MTNEKQAALHREYGLLGAIIVIQMLIMLWFGAQKVGYHVDEYWTYGLANHYGGKTMELQEGVPYQADEIFLDYLTVAPEHAFDYENVWNNQREDVHPPFYYVLIHTICSLMPGVFSKWVGIAVNMVCLLFADLLLYQLAKELFGRIDFSLVTTALFGCSLCTVNMVLFIRMYALLTIAFLALALLFCRYYPKKSLDLRFCLLLWGIAVCGTMTQYYFLIYLFFLCLFFGVHLLVDRRWRDTARYMGALGAAGAACILIFPDMVRQIFGGSNRGKQAFESLAAKGSYGGYLKEYYGIINEQLFCRAFPAVLVVLLALLLAAICRKGVGRIEAGKLSRSRWAMLAFGVGGYFFLVVKIAPYRTLRYIMPISGIFLLFVLYLILWSAQRAFGRKTARRLFLAAALAFGCVILFGYGEIGIAYTYQETDAYVQAASCHRDKGAVYVYNKKWKIPASSRELEQYQEYVFVKKAGLREFIAESKEQPLIVYLMKDMDNEELIQEIYQGNAWFTKHEKLYENTYANVYCFYGG